MSVLVFAACRDDAPQPLAPEPVDAPAADVTVIGDGSVRIIVALERGAVLSRITEQVEDLGGSIYRTYENIGAFAVSVTDEQRKAIEGLPGVAGVSDDKQGFLELDVSLGVIGADITRATGLTGAGKTVAILDTGFDQEHPFLAGRVVAEACFSTNQAANSISSLCLGGATSLTGVGASSLDVPACDGGPVRGNLCNHGQHVAGIAAGGTNGGTDAPASGVASGANLVLVKMFSRAENCGTRPSPCATFFNSDLLAGLNFVLGLVPTQDIVALNMSFGYGEFATACDDEDFAVTLAALLLRTSGVMPIKSAGNSGFANAVSFPGCVSSVVAVGNSTSDDLLNSGSNRGDLLRLIAPGTEIISSIENDGYTAFTGTSMAAPHVTGAFAVLSQAYPSENIEQLLDRMISTGVPITYNNGANTTPRLNLAAAAEVEPQPPSVTLLSTSVTVPEGTPATNGGTITDPYGGAATLTASRGMVVVNGSGWAWSEPTNENGPAYTVTLTATSSLGASTTSTFTVAVSNVAPTLTLNPNQVTTGEELTTIPISATFTDPGTLDSHSATVQCYSGSYGTLQQPTTITSNVQNGVLTGTISSPGCPYGDNGIFTASVTVRDDDGGEDQKSFNVTISNVAPVVSIAGDNATIINGTPVVLTSVGAPTVFDGLVTDRGSDDLYLEWDWNDGTAPATLTSLNAPPLADGTPSPSVNPRDVSDERLKLFTAACFRTVQLSAEDDDGGKGARSIAVIITGNSGRVRSSGYWQTQYRNVRTSPVGQDVLDCYLKIANQLSVVFSEQRAASTAKQAGAVLQNAGGGGDMQRILDQQLLAAWINFADGAWRWDTMVDSDGNGTPDATFGALISAAEVVRANPSSSRAQLEAQKWILERLNLSHGG